MQNQDDRLEIDATHFSEEQVCELLKNVMQAISECIKMGHSAYIRNLPADTTVRIFTSQR